MITLTPEMRELLLCVCVKYARRYRKDGRWFVKSVKRGGMRANAIAIFENDAAFAYKTAREWIRCARWIKQASGVKPKLLA